MIVELIGGGQLVVKALATDAYASVTRAAALLHAQVTRVIARRKQGSTKPTIA